MVKIVFQKSNITSNKIDAEIDFNKLVVIQMNRCNLALSQGAFQFSTSVQAFSCMLSHLRQRDEIYKDEMDKLSESYNKDIKRIEGRKNNKSSYQELQMKTSIKEYELLVRLCSRHNLFPLKRGELTNDEDDDD